VARSRNPTPVESQTRDRAGERTTPDCHLTITLNLGRIQSEADRNDEQRAIMKQKILEGTWEEILLHASELSGQRVRLTILTDPVSSRPLTESLDKLLQGRVGRVCFQPSNLSERTGQAFADLLAAKYNFPR
jgi:hypothetical protein